MIYKVEIEHPANHSTYYVGAKDVAHAAEAALKQDSSLFYEDDQTSDDDTRFIAANRRVKSVHEFAYLGQFVPLADQAKEKADV